MTDVAVLNIYLHGERIGTLTHVGYDRTLFSFSESYRENPDRGCHAQAGLHNQMHLTAISATVLYIFEKVW